MKKIVLIVLSAVIVIGAIIGVVLAVNNNDKPQNSASVSETVSPTERETNSESEETSASETGKSSNKTESDSVSASENESEEISDSESAEESESNSENESESAGESESFDESVEESESESVHTHKYNKEVATDKYKVSAATCYKKAKYYYSCECGEAGKETFEAGSFAPHISVLLKGRAATCTESGLTDGKICGVCNKVLVAQNIVPALGHNLVHHEAKEIYNCYDYWWDEYDDCTRCDYSTKIILPPSHKYVKGICSVCTGIEPTDEKYFTVEELEDGTCSISANSKFKEDYPNGIIIPSTINGKTVTKIGGFGYSDVKQIIIPDTVTEIAADAFRSSELESIFIPDSVTVLGQCAFSGCDNLTDLTIGDGVTVIETTTFFGCNSLKNVIIGKNVTTIKSWAFYTGNCLIEKMVIPRSVTMIDWSVVSDYMKIKNLYYSGTFDSWVAALSSNPSTSDFLQYTENFYIDNEPIKEIEISDSDIFSKARFKYYSWLESIVIKGVTEIGEAAFAECANLTRVKIESDVVSIGANAFEGSGITSIEISSSVTSIGSNAFNDCVNLTSLKYEGTVEEWENVTLGECAFTGIQTTEVICSDGVSMRL